MSEAADRLDELADVIGKREVPSDTWANDSAALLRAAAALVRACEEQKEARAIYSNWLFEENAEAYETASNNLTITENAVIQALAKLQEVAK